MSDPFRKRQWRRALAALAAALALVQTAPSAAFQVGEPSPATKRVLDHNFHLVLTKRKGPYTPNYCVCEDGSKRPVLGADGRVANRCGAAQTRFCGAFRAAWAETLAGEGLYLGNIFASDLYDWDRIPNHHDLVRGYILEKFLTDTHPEHKLSEMKGFGGLSGAEYEARDMPLFFERYLAATDFRDNRHFLLAYELQKRYFVRSDTGQIQKVRNLASRIQSGDPDFKPLRDATHNRVSAALIPRLAAWRDDLPASAGAEREDLDALIAEIERLTRLDETALAPQLADLGNPALRARLGTLMPTATAAALPRIEALASLMGAVREAVAAGSESAADRRRLVDLNVTAGAVIQGIGDRLLNDGPALTVGEHLRLLRALVESAYGAGLLTGRESQALDERLKAMLSRPDSPRETFRRDVERIARSVEWSQNGAMLAFAEVLPAWTYLMPEVTRIGDDILRGSPMLLVGESLRRLTDHLAGSDPVRHSLFGQDFTTGVRALNPGLAVGTLRVAPPAGGYTRDQVVALTETPADLAPAAGILTRGEGNLVSHVQLLARALGIPNAVAAPAAYDAIAPHDGREVFLVVTPRGRLVLKESAAMDATDRAVLAEFTRNRERTGEGALAGGGAKLHIDRQRLDLSAAAPIPLHEMRRADSGIRSGPKAAYLGELKHLFPENVARGLVVPFGAYHAHFQTAPVAVPPELRGEHIATEGEPLAAFAGRAYDEFFARLIPAGTGEQALADWIRPRLAVIRHSIRQAPLDPALTEAIRRGLAAQGLLREDVPTSTVGCFVRSDTNVEDQDDFNGAGLNLTLFNLETLDDIYAGLKEVWASPFSDRSFSWRQTLIDQPLWVLPSVVILESVPSDKSGVLVTADIDTGDQTKMLIATSEGVGGAVDGTPAETLLWSPEGVELITQFKSPLRRVLTPGGGSELVSASGRDTVLNARELAALTAAAAKIRETLTPALDPSGNPRAWDIEFGFRSGKLWLFQVRPFIGNEEMQNVPALAALESGSGEAGGSVSLGDRVE